MSEHAAQGTCPCTSPPPPAPSAPHHHRLSQGASGLHSRQRRGGRHRGRGGVCRTPRPHGGSTRQSCPSPGSVRTWAPFRLLSAHRPPTFRDVRRAAWRPSPCPHPCSGPEAPAASQSPTQEGPPSYVIGYGGPLTSSQRLRGTRKSGDSKKGWDTAVAAALLSTMWTAYVNDWFALCRVWARAVFTEPNFFLLLRTALMDCPQGPPTANHQPPPTVNRQLRPTANRHQPPTTNHQRPTANRHQPPNANRHPPIANRHQPPTANRHICAYELHVVFSQNCSFQTPSPPPPRTALVLASML